MGGKIDGYLDCTSPYSYMALLYLRKQRPLLAQYDIEVEFHPVFLGGINVGSGNKPPWTLPAKAKYGVYDFKRAVKYFKAGAMSSPPFFPILSIMPQRCMLYVKANHPREKFEEAFLSLWTYSFIKHIDISQSANMVTCLGEHFPPSEVEKIMAAAKSQEYKDALTANTNKALDRGAFGAPWFWLRNAKGEEEPLFGSDRWAYMWDFLGLDWKDVEIVNHDEGMDEAKAKL